MLSFKKYPNLTVIISCFFWGTYWVPLRYINDNSNSSVWPLFFSFLLLSLIFIKPLIKKILDSLYKRDYYFLLSCLFSAIGMSLYSESLMRGEAATVVIFFYLAPVWGTIFGNFFLKKKLTLQRVISIIIGLIGLGIILGIDKGTIFPTSLVEFLALFSGLSWALGMTFFHLSNSTTAIEKTTLTTFLMAFIFLLLCLLPNGRIVIISQDFNFFSNVYMWIILFSFFWLLPSFFLSYSSVEVLDPGRINILFSFEVAVGFFSAYMFTYEIIGMREILGAFCIIFSCIVDIFKINKINY